MMMRVFAVYDSAIMTWRAPMFARNKGEMIRSFSDAVNNTATDISKHPQDYTLFDMGSWNDDNNLFDLLVTPVALGKGIEYVKAVVSA